MSAPGPPIDGDPGVRPGDPRCWQSIGVWGHAGPRCPELARVRHCRNCEIFVAAGRTLLDREPPAGHGLDWMRALHEHATDQRRARDAVLVFQAAGELLALPLDVVMGVSPWRPIRRVPHRVDGLLLGIANLDGTLRLCVSLEAVFGLPRPQIASPPQGGRFLAIGERDTEWVLPVEDALSVHLAPVDALREPPATVARSREPYLRGLFPWRDRTVGLLDHDALLGTLRRQFP